MKITVSLAACTSLVAAVAIDPPVADTMGDAVPAEFTLLGLRRIAEALPRRSAELPVLGLASDAMAAIRTIASVPNKAAERSRRRKRIPTAVFQNMNRPSNEVIVLLVIIGCIVTTLIGYAVHSMFTGGFQDDEKEKEMSYEQKQYMRELRSRHLNWLAREARSACRGRDLESAASYNHKQQG
ncbi:hypothetical protein BBP40_006612 [Aspergillus hancockii]|nr:hypothetical protein BBP40_006612 [Aspergillus hancockii]